MHPYPHQYRVDASAGPEGSVALSAAGLETIESQPPVEFGGPGDRWSPEALLAAALADCLVLTFRAIARASQFTWSNLQVKVDARLERVDNVTRFTHFDIEAELTVPAGTDEHKSTRLLEKSEAVCLITQSLNGSKALTTRIRYA